MLRVDGEYYTEAMDEVADEIEFLAMAVHSNDPFLTIAQREGMMLCDAQCECKTYGLEMMARGEPPVCRGVNRNRAVQEKRHGHISKKVRELPGGKRGGV